MFAVLLLAVAAATGCNSGTVTGSLQFEGQPVQGAQVQAGGQDTTSGPDGAFALVDVPAGMQQLTASLALDDGGFVERSVEIKVAGDVDTGTLTLPEPVVLSLVEATTTTATIEWTESTDTGFREYKIYRHYQSALDETTGEMLHVADTVGETTYFDDGMDMDIGLSPDEDYYYRVYVMDEFGLLGGSNILQVNTPMWDVENFDVTYTLTEADQFAGPHEVTGLTWDGSCLWVIYFGETGGYYDLNDVWLNCRDLYSGDTVREFYYQDEYLLASGLGFDGESLWLNYTSTGSGERVLKEIDLDDGTVLGQLMVENGNSDVSWNGTHMLVANHWNEIHITDLDNGALVDRIPTPFQYSTLRGVAYRPGETWLSSVTCDQLVILDDDGDHIGIADLPIGGGHNYNDGLQMAFVEDQLAVAKAGRVYLFDVTVDP